MKFRAAVLATPGSRLTIEKLQLGSLAPTDVVVRVAATSICHTDVEVIDGDVSPGAVPIVPGHECAGWIDWTGASVQGLHVGDPVVLSWNPNCGGCYYCARSQPILCSRYVEQGARGFHFDGAPRLFRNGEPLRQLMFTGTFAERVVVDAQCAVKVPRDMPMHLACLIGCAVMTGVGAALNIARVQPGDLATVVGCGAVGLSTIQGARLAGAARIIAIDRDASRLALARQLGATDVLLADDAVAEAHAELTAGRGADHVFEAAGNEAAFRLTMEIVRPGGQVVWLGKVPPSQDVAFRWGSLMAEKRITRSSYGGARPQRDFPMLAKAYLDGTLLLDEYVTSRMSLDEVNEGVDRLRRGADIRGVIVMQP
jgi:S-(hydroxymethyl)glutathione dehydrogenase/alcohol dehydrogenase